MANIFVGCKLPNGIILELITPNKDRWHPAPTGKRVALNGANTNRIARTNPADAAYGVTEVDEDFWKEWLKTNRDMAFIKNKQVFAAATRAELESEASDMHVLVRTGLEPLNPDPAKDSRVQSGIEADKGQLKRLGAVA